jgi:hypothetical protein
MRCAAGRSCAELLAGGVNESGIYPIDPDGDGGEPQTDIFCEMTLAEGGWTLISVASGDADRSLVGDGYCPTPSPATGCRGHLPIAAVSGDRELLVVDQTTGRWLVLAGFSGGADSGLRVLSGERTLGLSESCEAPQACGDATSDPQLHVRATSGFAANHQPPLFAYWRLGGLWLGANPGAGLDCGGVVRIGYSDASTFFSRADRDACSLPFETGAVALFWR